MLTFGSIFSRWLDARRAHASSHWSLIFSRPSSYTMFLTRSEYGAHHAQQGEQSLTPIPQTAVSTPSLRKDVCSKVRMYACILNVRPNSCFASVEYAIEAIKVHHSNMCIYEDGLKILSSLAQQLSVSAHRKASFLEWRSASSHLFSSLPPLRRSWRLTATLAAPCQASPPTHAQ